MIDIIATESPQRRRQICVKSIDYVLVQSLDISDAFDTIDYNILMDCIFRDFVILNWLIFCH